MSEQISTGICWHVVKKGDITDSNKNQIVDLVLFVETLFSKVFDMNMVLHEECNFYNDMSRDSPIFFNNIIPYEIVTSVSDVGYWDQLLYQLSHEMCHFILHVSKDNRDLFFEWFEEVLCEAFSLYTLFNARKYWKTCRLHKIHKNYWSNIQTYADRILLTTSIPIDKNISGTDFIGNYKGLDQKGKCEKIPYERNIVYDLFLQHPKDIKKILKYTQYYDKNNNCIDFTKWDIDTRDKGSKDNTLVTGLMNICPGCICI